MTIIEVETNWKDLDKSLTALLHKEFEDVKAYSNKTFEAGMLSFPQTDEDSFRVAVDNIKFSLNMIVQSESKALFNKEFNPL